MITCELHGEIVEANVGMERKADYRCPECRDNVIPKLGVKNVPHFAHHPGTECSYGDGETVWHRRGKRFVADYFRTLGCDVRLEEPLGNRRTDLLVIHPNGKRVAFEFQLKEQNRELYTRTRDLLRRVDKVYWVLPWNVAEEGLGCYRATSTYTINALYSNKHPVGGKPLFFDDKNKVLFVCEKRPYELHVKESTWYDVDYGGERSAGGYTRTSKRWVKLLPTREIALA